VIKAVAVPENQEKAIDLNRDAVKKAIAQGLALIKEGKSKSEAAQAMYASLKDESRELVVGAFVAGATLTEKGAMTYWYNCKRRAEKQAKNK
jgi:hypothetical protein